MVVLRLSITSWTCSQRQMSVCLFHRSSRVNMIIRETSSKSTAKRSRLSKRLEKQEFPWLLFCQAVLPNLPWAYRRCTKPLSMERVLITVHVALLGWTLRTIEFCSRARAKVNPLIFDRLMITPQFVYEKGDWQSASTLPLWKQLMHQFPHIQISMSSRIEP